MYGMKANPFLSILAIFILCSPCLSGAVEEKAVSGDNAAVVNGAVITRQEINTELDQLRSRAARQGQEVPDSELDNIKNNILDNLINQVLLYQESVKKGVVVDDQEITDKLSEIKKRFPDENDYKKILDEMGMSEADIKIKIGQGISIEKFIESQILSKIVVSDQESRAFYDANPAYFQQPEQVQASHILIKVGAEATETQRAEAKKKLETIREKIQTGEDFSALAREFSECPSSAKGGDLGLFGRGQMVKPFEDAAFSLKPDEVSPVVETMFGYHLIKVTDKKSASVIGFNDAKDKISGHLKHQNTQKEVKKHIDKLRETAEIKKYI
ncbi:MAG: peptidylprolyl isomerase [Desulfobacterales bacterium]|nr:peptidylprolyl isomerase [Desulfobacterales bacterium]MDD4071551.1 peptidylprolyl isomerase [Desulfobacterales bacterium]MDD4391540.1 peptidylprolyl isomerase [Desulfobacterales bacterium]